MNRFTLIIISLLAIASCNGTTGGSAATQTETQQAATQQVAPAGDDKHSEQSIRQRLTDIYNEAFNEQNHDLLALDHKFMSKEYNNLQDKAMKIAERTGDIVIDADHWVQGQDWTNPTMDIVGVENITATTALARVKIVPHLPGDAGTATLLILPLVFERGDWFIDNMQQYYEGELLDEKAWYKKYVDNDGKMEQD